MSNQKCIPEAIQWSEGMLLSPQHFQQQSLRTEGMLHHLMTQLSPHYWGILKMNIDEDKLINGLFRILEIEAVMPDGLIIHHVSETDGDLQIDLTPLAKDLPIEPVLIHLLVPIRRPVSANPDAEVIRYDSIDGDAIIDENTGYGEVHISRLKPRIQLMATNQPAKKYVPLPLAQMTLKDEIYKPTDYVAPWLRLSSRFGLGAALRKMTTELREKATQLSSVVESGASSVGRALTLQHQQTIQHLVAGLPQLEVVLRTDQSHPFQVFRALANLVGHMASLRPGLVPPLLTDYQHNNIRPGFDEAMVFIQNLLKNVRLSYSTLKFRTDRERFYLPMDNAWNFKRLLIGITPGKGVNDKQLAQWLESCVISSQNKIKIMQERRLLGAERAVIERDDEYGVVPASGVKMVAITIIADAIEMGETLVLLPQGGGRNQMQIAQSIVLYIPHSTA